MRALGAELLIVTNASGGLNPRFRGGEIMVLVDHINLLFRAGRRNPRGMAEDGPAVAAGWSGPSWGQVASERDLGVPASFAGYDADLVEETFRIARLENFVVHPGVYVAMIGPNYETRAEYRFLRRLGGDAVGMSTVPEVLTAVHLGMRVLALSVITNTARPDAPQRVEAQEVVDWAARAEPNLVKILHGIVARQEPAPKDSKHIRSS
jgi:purine-nucleoside phosphorylase